MTTTFDPMVHFLLIFYDTSKIELPLVWQEPIRRSIVSPIPRSFLSRENAREFDAKCGNRSICSCISNLNENTVWHLWCLSGTIELSSLSHGLSIAETEKTLEIQVRR